jgi:hypothetical protein
VVFVHHLWREGAKHANVTNRILCLPLRQIVVFLSHFTSPRAADIGACRKIHLDQLAAAGGWRDLPTLAASMLHPLIEDDMATERPQAAAAWVR